MNLLDDLQERVRADLPVHRPRPVSRASHQRPRRGDVPRQDRRARPPAAIYDQPAPSVHAGAALGGAGPRSRRRASPQARHPHAATFPRRSIPQRAAASTPVAGSTRKLGRPRTAAPIDPELRCSSVRIIGLPVTTPRRRRRADVGVAHVVREPVAAREVEAASSVVAASVARPSPIPDAS